MKDLSLMERKFGGKFRNFIEDERKVEMIRKERKKGKKVGERMFVGLKDNAEDRRDAKKERVSVHALQ